MKKIVSALGILFVVILLMSCTKINPDEGKRRVAVEKQLLGAEKGDLLELRDGWLCVIKHNAGNKLFIDCASRGDSEMYPTLQQKYYSRVIKRNGDKNYSEKAIKYLGQF